MSLKIKCMKAIIILLILVSLGCSSSEKKKAYLSFSHFPEEVEVNLKEVTTPPVLNFVGELLVVDNFLVAYSLMSDSLFQVFDISGFEYLGSHVPKGEGPGEESFIAPNLQYYDSNSFLFKTHDKVKIVSFEKQTNEIILQREINLPNEFLDVMHIVFLYEKVIGWNLYNVTNEFEFQTFDLATAEISNFGPIYPVNEYKNELSDNASLYSKSILNKPDGKYFAALYDRYPFLRIYDTNGNLVKEVRYLNQQIDPAKFLSTNDPTKYIGQQTLNYMKLKVTNKYIYGLYAGKTHQELRSQEYKVDDFCTEVHVWDWLGNPVAKLMLDRPVFCFAVAQDDSFIMFSSVNELDKLFYIEINDLSYLTKTLE